jgi:O-antigen ligase/tetratricopeptide (TPR) repeat protein
MALIRIADPHEFRPVHVVMMVLCLLGLLGVCLLSSAEKAQALPDGAIEWHPDSPLLAIVELLNLRNLQPTLRGVAVKNLVHGVASGAGIIVAALGLVFLARGAAPVGAETVIDLDEVAAGETSGRRAKRHVDATRTAQALLALFLAWSATSALWSHAPEFSWRATALLAIQAVWALALAWGLNRRAARWAANGLLAVLTVTAGLAWAYHRERNPTLRASYPIGNPLLLAGVLIPAILLAITTVAGGVIGVARRRPVRGILLVIAGLSAVAVAGYVFKLTGSRGPLVGLAAGLLALVFFAGSKRVKQVAIGVAVIGLIAVAVRYYSTRYADSATGRSTSIRVRLFAWDYALQLIAERPLAGLGQGGYSLTADSLATGADALADPAALEYRIGSAHSEYLEVAADLGSIGLVLWVAALGLTWLGAYRAIPEITVAGQRRALIALVAAHVGLCVAELFGVGLRLEGYPYVFYTVWGLVWALSRPATPHGLVFLGKRRILQPIVAAVAIIVGLLMISVARSDYAAARAEYDTQAALQRVDYDAATALAQRAYRDRLAPQRRMSAGRRLVETHLRIAEAMRAEYYDRLRLAETQGVRDNVFAEQLQYSRARLLAHLQAGLETLAHLRAADPSPFGMGLLAAALHAVNADLAELEGRSDDAAASRTAALEILQQQNLREPFVPEVAARYVMIAGPTLGPLDALEILARPLRLVRAPSIYLDLLDSWSATDEFVHVVLPAIESLAAQGPATLAADPNAPFAAEILRIGAIASFLQNDFVRSIRFLEAAVAIYGRLKPSAPFAQASALAELADARFMNTPAEPLSAIAAGNEAIKQAPRSERGRELVNAMATRLVTYHLASGNEPAARGVIRGLFKEATDEELDALVADRYVNLSYGVMNIMLARSPERLMSWSRRAVELAPDSAQTWFLAAELAIEHGEALDIIRCIFQVIRCGTTAENLAALVDKALVKLPDNPTLLSLRARLDVPPDDPMPGGEAGSLP